MNILLAPYKDKVFLRKTLLFALPIAAQSLLNSVVNMIDNVMIGDLGDQAISAVGQANKLFFVMCLLLFGICSGSGILASQYWGMKDVRNIKKVMALALPVGIVITSIVSIVAFNIPHTIMNLFVSSRETANLGVEYLKIAVWSYPLVAISMIYQQILRATGSVKIPVITTLVAILTNVCLNYTLIYGNFGAPALGVKGAAIATLAARVLEVIVLLSYVYIKNGPPAIKPREFLWVDKSILKLYFTKSFPVILNELMWGLGTTIYSVVYGRLGDEAVAAITVCTTMAEFMNVFFMGVANASGVIMGNLMGENKLSVAKTYAKKFLILGVELAVVVSFFAVLFRNPFTMLFSNLSSQAMNYARIAIVINACYAIFKITNYIMITGIFRSGGDTKFCLMLDILGVWCIGIPLAVITGLFLKWPVPYVFAALSFEEVVKAIIGIRRYKQYKWLNNIVGNNVAHKEI